MTYWKFLRANAISPFTGYVWPAPGVWVETEPVRACRSGIHACRLADLPYWLLDELWLVELAGPIVETPYKVVAGRARLVRPVPAWNRGRARDLALACVARTGEHAARELRDAGLEAEASRLARAARDLTVDSVGRLGDLAGELAAGAEAAGRDRAARLCGYLGDAAGGAESLPVASIAYIAARAASHRGGGGHAGPWSVERAWQADWLARRLSLRAEG